MKTIIAASLLALASGAALATDVGVSITVGQPNFYGQINIGDFPRPSVVYAQPVLVERRSSYVVEPIYLRVPPGHAKHWSKHCRAYNACGRNVYFVQDNWYLNEYAPQYRERHGHGEGRGRGDDHGHGNDHDRGHDRGDDDRGNGNGNGHGNGKGHGRD